VEPPASPRKYWTRRGIAGWLCKELSRETPTLVGIDHGFSFPLAYFEEHALPLDWLAFLDDFQHHWPTDHINTYLCGTVFAVRVRKGRVMRAGSD
jgi:hypothetical protein